MTLRQTPSRTAPPLSGQGAASSPASAVLWLGWAIVVLAALASVVGVFSGGGPGRREVVGLHGARVVLYGIGLFRDDTLLIGAGNRGQDAVVLFGAVPVLAVLLARVRRGDLRARVLLTGMFGFFAYYYYASMCFATAFNRIFPLYVVLLGAYTFGFVISVSRLDALRVAAAFPRAPSPRVLAAYLLTVAGLLTAVWLPPMAQALVTGEPPTLVNTYTSETTWALDLALIVPIAVWAAVLALRTRAAGLLAALMIMVLNLAIGLVLIGQAVAQVMAHALSTAEVLGLVATFAVLTCVGAVLLYLILTRCTTPGRAARVGTSGPAADYGRRT